MKEQNNINKAKEHGNMENENGIKEDVGTSTTADQNYGRQERESQSSSRKESKSTLVSTIKNSFSSRKFLGGAYATILSIVVIVVLLLLNLIVTDLDLKVDVTSDDLYSLTEDTKEYIQGIEDDITIYYLAQTGSEDDTLRRIVEEYENYSSKITVEYKDPVMYPKFASQYTEESVTADSVIVVNHTNGRSKYVDVADMYEYEVDYSTYQSYLTGIDVEGEIGAALSYVTTEDLPLMYMVQGHGESSISTTLASSIAKVNVSTDTLTTLTEETIPEDCSFLFINAPQTDYSEAEVAMIKDYLAEGGDAIIFVDYMVEGLPNFNSLLRYYGIEFAEGIVLEGNSGYYMGQYVNNLVPDINTHEITTELTTKGTAVVVPAAKGIQILEDKRATIEITPLLTTSDLAYSKVDMNSENVEFEEGDINGPFYLGVDITETYNEVETNLIVYGSAYIIEESMLTYSSIGNLNLIISTIQSIASMESSIAIPSKSVIQEYLTLTAAQANFWGAIVVILLPVSILILGGLVCLRRRKK